MKGKKNNKKKKRNNNNNMSSPTTKTEGDIDSMARNSAIKQKETISTEKIVILVIILLVVIVFICLVIWKRHWLSAVFLWPYKMITSSLQVTTTVTHKMGGVVNTLLMKVGLSTVPQTLILSIATKWWHVVLGLCGEAIYAIVVAAMIKGLNNSLWSSSTN